MRADRRLLVSAEDVMISPSIAGMENSRTQSGIPGNRQNRNLV